MAQRAGAPALPPPSLLFFALHKFYFDARDLLPKPVQVSERRSGRCGDAAADVGR